MRPPSVIRRKRVLRWTEDEVCVHGRLPSTPRAWSTRRTARLPGSSLTRRPDRLGGGYRPVPSGAEGASESKTPLSRGIETDREAVGASHAREEGQRRAESQDALGPRWGGDLSGVGSGGSWGGAGKGAMEGSPRGLGASGARPPDTAQRGDRGVTPGHGTAG